MNAEPGVRLSRTLDDFDNGRSAQQWLPGQHVALFASSHRTLDEGLGFAVEYDGMSQVVGRWLDPASAP